MAEDWRPDAGEVFTHVVDGLAAEASERVTQGVIGNLQAKPAILNSVYPGASLWDEICIQTRGDTELMRVYDAAVERAMHEVTANMGDLERVALWLQTYNGALFVEKFPDASLDEACRAASLRDVREYVMAEHINYQRMNYENDRIREACGE